MKYFSLSPKLSVILACLTIKKSSQRISLWTALRQKDGGRFEFLGLPWGREILVLNACLGEVVKSHQLWTKTEKYISQY
jgi:hypothetical protein